MIELPASLNLGLRMRRLLALVLFFTVLITFRHLAVIGVVFVAASAGLGGLAERLGARFRLGPKLATGIVFGLFALVIGALLALGVSRSLKLYSDLAHGGMQERLAALRASEPVQKLESLEIDLKPLFESIERFASEALGALKLSGELLLHALIGFLIALVYRIDQQEVDAGLGQLQRDSILGVMLRLFGFVAEAVVAALKLQVAVALVNTCLTALVILALGLPGAPTLIALVFFLGLIPVVGNLASGALLSILAYIHQGVIGVVVFLVSTFVLHKLESFYLNPRLSRKHVHLPPLAIIISLLAFEHLFGIVGLFLSFPTIYLGTRIAAFWKEAEPQPTLPAG